MSMSSVAYNIRVVRVVTATVGVVVILNIPVAALRDNIIICTSG